MELTAPAGRSRQAIEAELASLRAELAQVKSERDEYKALAGIGRWHNDCRPNRHKAAQEIIKSQQRIDALAESLRTLTAAWEALETWVSARQPVSEMQAVPNGVSHRFYSPEWVSAVLAEMRRLKGQEGQ